MNFNRIVVGTMTVPLFSALSYCSALLTGLASFEELAN